MKWFHHECSAKHDPKLQVLGSVHGAAGLGIYWGLLEEIGGHSETFHLKVCGVSEESDQEFVELTQNRCDLPKNDSDVLIDSARVPKIPVSILARILFTTRKRLLAVIETAASEGLFDKEKWARYNVLYSPSFEHRADDYTRRQRRSSANVRTESVECSEGVRKVSEQSADTLRTMSEKVLLEQNRAEQIQKRKRTEQTAECHDLPTASPQVPVENLAKSVIAPYREQIASILKDWNEHSGHRFDWTPSETDLKRIFYEGNGVARAALCEQASALAGYKVTFPLLVIHAFGLMLRASETGRITNPEGWLRASLFGKRNGNLPWILAEGSFPPRSPP